MISQELSLFVAAGVLGGVVNTLAGGAKLFVFPLLLASGLPPIVANATGTVALWPAQMPAAWLNRQALQGGREALASRIIPALVGALCGALALIVSSEEAFLAVIPVFLIAAVAVIALGNRTALILNRLVPVHRQGLTTGSMMFATGFYGGFFGAGMGFLLVAVLTASGIASIRSANTEKNLAAVAINTTAVLPLLISGLVDIPAALGVLVGGLAGGYLGGRFAGVLPETPMRLLIATLGFALTANFLFR